MEKHPGLIRVVLTREAMGNIKRNRIDSSIDRPSHFRDSHKRPVSALSPVLPTDSDQALEQVLRNLADEITNSELMMNQLQIQSTNYDLELARRKRDLLDKLSSLHSSNQHLFDQFLQLMQKVARAELPTEHRIKALNQLYLLIPVLGTDTNGLFSRGTSVGAAGEPCLRLIEACLCESHCPLELAVQLSRLAAHIVSLNTSKSHEVNGSISADDRLHTKSIISASAVGYVQRLLRKLVVKTNPQYHSGILSHLSRILSDFKNTGSDSNDSPQSSGWSEWLPSAASMLSTLVRFGESLNQPINVSRFAHLVGLVGRCLLASHSDNLEVYCERFSDVADILVGWGVDPTSVEKGIDLDSIYSELRSGLSSWFVFQSKSKNGNEENLAVCGSIQEMMSHLLEDSENSLNTAINHCQSVSSMRSNVVGAVRSTSDPNVHLISVRLFVSLFASICEGITTLSKKSNIPFHELFTFPPNTLSEWVERILQLTKTVHSCYHPFSSNGRPHVMKSAALSIPIALLDNVDTAVFRILACLVNFPDCPETAKQAIHDHIIYRLKPCYLPLTENSLSALLKLISTILKIQSRVPSVDPNALIPYFGVGSLLHSYKIQFGNCGVDESPSEQIQHTLLSLRNITNLHSALLQLGLLDFKMALKSIYANKNSLSLNLLLSGEHLGLFSLSILSSLLSDFCTDEWKLDLRHRFANCLSLEILSIWHQIPLRLRIGILCFLHDSSFIASTDPHQLLNMLSTFMSFIGTAVECYLTLEILEMSLDRITWEVADKHLLMTKLTHLSEFILKNSAYLYVSNINLFVKCVHAIIKCFDAESYSHSHQINAALCHLARIACSSSCSQSQKAGSDLLLFCGSFLGPHSPFVLLPSHTELAWFIMRRADHNATSLLMSEDQKSLESGLVSSISAFPSLPAVAGVLAMITRGAPYNLQNRSSRLKILGESNDWLRRLGSLISPLPFDRKLEFCISTDTNFVLAVLWYSAWTMVDYKLKVAPWANPLKSFLCLEGALHAFTQPIPSFDSTSTNASPIVHFHVASARSLVGQPWNKQLHQARLLLAFTGFLERIIFNATEGLALALPRPLPAACNFFVANKATCTHWFNRVRSLLVRMADNLPSSPFFGMGPAIDVASTAVYHAYSLLANVAHCKDASDRETWLTQLNQSGGADDILIHVSKALRRLGAWEEIMALAQWTDSLFDENHHMFSWLHGVALLTRGYWDEGISSLHSFLDLALRSKLEAYNLTTPGNNGKLNPSLLHVSSILLQEYANEGNYVEAINVRNRLLEAIPKSKSNSQLFKKLDSPFMILSSRLDCLKKLNDWSNLTDQRDDELPEVWSLNDFIKNSDRLLLTTYNQKVKSNKLPLDEDSKRNIAKLITDIRQINAAVSVSPPANLFLTSNSDCATACGDQLGDWLIQAATIYNETSSVPTFNHSNIVWDSSWQHLLCEPKKHTDIELQACEWACLHQSPQLAQRLLLRHAKCLSLVEKMSGPNPKDHLESLCSLANAGSHLKSHKLTQSQMLKFSGCLAQVLWMSDRPSTNGSCPNDPKLLAIATIAQGLRQTLLEEASQDLQEHSNHCRLAAETALRLFRWLEQPTHVEKQNWAEHIHQEARKTMNNGYELTSKTDSPSDPLTIAHNLNFFSQLADEPWINGLPLVTIEGFFTSKQNKVTTIQPTSAWTSRLLMMATHLSSTGSSVFAWLTMADWCYSRGQKQLDELHLAAKQTLSDEQPLDLNQNAVPVLFNLTQQEERSNLISILDKNATSLPDSSNPGSVDRYISKVIAALIMFLSTNEVEEDEDSTTSMSINNRLRCPYSPMLRLSQFCPDDVNKEIIYPRLNTYLSSTLPEIFPSSNIAPEITGFLHDMVRTLIQRQYNLYTSAAQAYATFLTLADQPLPPIKSKLPERSISKLDTTTATLKILDLLCVPSRGVRDLVAGFLNQGAPSLPPVQTTLNSNANPTNTSVLSSQPPLGGPSIWEACLDQILVRLNLPDPVIRDCLVNLLSRLILSTDSTNTSANRNSASFRLAVRLVFPSVVDAIDSRQSNSLINSALAMSASNCGNKTSTNTFGLAVSNNAPLCFKRLVTALHNGGFGELVCNVETFVFELQRITLLWEELWLGSLMQHLDELNKKIGILESEIKRDAQLALLKIPTPTDPLTKESTDKENFDSGCINQIQESIDKLKISSTPIEAISAHYSNGDIVQDTLTMKYIATLQPTLDLLSQLSSVTLNTLPETPHEQWFQKTFGPMIEDLQEAILHPVDVKNFKAPALLIRQLIQQLQTLHQPTHSRFNTGMGSHIEADQKSSSRSVQHLNLHHLSPRLCEMSFGGSSTSPEPEIASRRYRIPLPGHASMESSYLMSRVAVLPTKTRPKRLVFRANNGRTYPYLLKGLEDLRLDVRIMHLFELANLALAETPSVSYAKHAVRTYSVTPLGVRSGLLQMVQGAIPLFTIYKRWQIRNSHWHQDDSSTTPAINVPRPGELFHARLKKLLTAAGQQYHPHSRSTWSVEILRNVLSSLEAETPADLLTRELWASNPSCATWWSVTRTFAKSAGLLSSLGYLVGLGDRHLDNLLVDLTTGHIIHIDYNVCFDKGRTLRVAERVPFRLTRIIRHALGPLSQDTLVRGTFRTSAEQALMIARNIMSPLSIQLKAFLIDPLVDWQLKKSSTSHSLVVSDYTHLSAYYGGGSAAYKNYNVSSVIRRLRRISAENRMYAGLLITRLLELYNSSCLPSVFTALDSISSRLSLWTDTSKALTTASVLNKRYEILSSASTETVVASEIRCRKVEETDQEVNHLRTDLLQRIESWITELSASVEIFRNGTNPTWLPSLILSEAPSYPALVTALNQYHTISRAYMSNSNKSLLETHWINCTNLLSSGLTALTKDSYVNAESVLEYLELTADKPKDACNSEIIEKLENAAEEILNTTLELHQAAEDNAISGQADISQDLDNLNLFVYDQGEDGVTAYCWALMDYLLKLSNSVMFLESEPKEWKGAPEQNAPFMNSKLNNLNQLNTTVNCMVSLFSVLGQQFSAGMEAYAVRELAFLEAVRDAVRCLHELHSNLTRLLVPEATEALVTAESCTVEQFSTFFIRQIAQSDATNLRQRVGDFFSIDPATKDIRLHQVLFAVHLALMNATDQMEEISMHVRSYGITAAAWYYVDIISQVSSVLLARSPSWREGATSLWGWTCPNPNYIPGAQVPDHESDISWSVELYTAGLTAFVSILEEGCAHWSAIRQSPNPNLQDLILTPFTETIDRFIGHLMSRLALASLVGMASGRLFCALVENAGLPIRLLLMEGEYNMKASGLKTTPCLAATKLMDKVNVQLAVTHSVSVQHLRAPASNLISRLVNRSVESAEHSFKIAQWELADRHLKHIGLTLSVYNWLHQPENPSPYTKSLMCRCNDSESFRVLVDVVNSIESCIQSATADSTESFENTIAKSPLLYAAQSICLIEKLRAIGPQAYPAYNECISLATRLKDAVEQKNKALMELTDLDLMIRDIKTVYELSWPTRDWFSKEAQTESQQNLLDRMLADALAADLHTKQLESRLHQAREELVATSIKTKDDAPTWSELFSDEASKRDGSQVSTSDSIHQSTKRMNHHSQPRRPGTLISTQTSLNLSSSPTTLAKQCSLLSSLRTTLSTLQKEHLSEMRQLIKLLRRYGAIQDQLLSETNISNEPNSNNISIVPTESWSHWLETHQLWTSNVLNTLKKLTSLISKLSIPPSYQKTPTNKNDAEEYLEQFDLVTDIISHCSLIRRQLMNGLISPLTNSTISLLKQDNQLSEIIDRLLPVLNSNFDTLHKGISDEIDCKERQVEDSVAPNLDQVNHLPTLSSEEKLSSQGLSIWYRICDRLNGYDDLLISNHDSPNSASQIKQQPFSVAVQVDACIKEATDPTNLALMYEGWTAWV